MHALLALLDGVTPVPAATDDGLTVSEVIANLPHDPASIFALVLLVVTYGGIFWIGRGQKTVPPGPGA